MGQDTVFYGELAAWWPLISPLEDYEEEAAFAAEVLKSGPRPVRRVLELGSGGGHNAAWLKAHFEMTLVDLQDEMLEVSRALNPECRHFQGDMRSFRIDERFDAVFVHDAIEYMVSEDELSQAFATAWAHLEPGGLALFIPDATTESFEEGSDHGGSDGDDGRAVRFLEWSWDPDPSDSTVQTEYAFVFRGADGAVRSAHETHQTGLFPEARWVALLEAQGFEVRLVDEETDEDRTGRRLFVGIRPG